MVETAYLRLLSSEMGNQVSWQLVSGATGQGTLSQAASLLAGQRLIVVVPASEVLITRVRVPTRQRKRLLDALPYALEEQLASDVESLHFAPGARFEDSEVEVAVVERVRLEGWLEKLAEHALVAQAIVPEQCLLDAGEGGRLWLEEKGAVLALAPGQWLALDGEQWAELAALALEGMPREALPMQLEVLDYRASPEYLPELPVPVHHQPQRGTFDAHLFSGYREGHTLSLLQGAYSRREQYGRLFRPWRMAAAVLVALGIVSLIGEVLERHHLASELVALDARLAEQFQAALPDEGRMVNPRVQLERALQVAGGGGGADEMTSLLNSVASGLHRAGDTELRALRYRPGEIELDLTASALERLDTIRAALEQEGRWRVEIQSAEARGEQVESRLVIRRGS